MSRNVFSFISNLNKVHKQIKGIQKLFKKLPRTTMMLLNTRRDDRKTYKIINFGQQLILGTIREHFYPRALGISLAYFKNPLGNLSFVHELPIF